MTNKKICSWIALLLCFILTMQFVACQTDPVQEEQTTTEMTDRTESNQTTDAPETTDSSETAEEPTTEDTTQEPAPEKNVAAKPSINFDKTVQVTENGNSANVTTATGLAYQATGYSSYNGGKFTIKAGHTVTFDGLFADKFNRLTLCYVSDAPLNCTVTYTVNGKTVNDLFYLEAGTQTFCALTLGYLESKQATNLTAIAFETCEGKNADFIQGDTLLCTLLPLWLLTEIEIHLCSYLSLFQLLCLS